MAALDTYLSQVQRLLHDSNNQFWSVAELTDYINESRKQVVGDTGCYRRLQTPGYLSVGVEQYAFGTVTGFNVTNQGTGYTSAPTVSMTGGGGAAAAATAVLSGTKVSYLVITNGGSGYTSAPTVSFAGGGGSAAAATAAVLLADTIDVVNINVYWGSSRYVLPRMPWTTFNARARYYQSYRGRPIVCSIYSNNSVFVQPAPDQTYTVDWDTVVHPTDLAGSDSEVIPALFKDPVQYYAAYKAKVKEQSWGEAEAFMKQYKTAALAAIRRSFTAIRPHPYA